MLKRIFSFYCTVFIGIFVSNCAEAQTNSNPIPHILVDQFGYLPQLEKHAIIRSPKRGRDAGRKFSPSARYAVIDTATGKVAYEGRPAAWKNGRVDEASGDRVWVFDFSAVTRQGRYVIRDIDRAQDSYPFEIRHDVYTPVLKAAFKTFYLQRAGFEKRAPFAPTGFSDRASHLGKNQDGEARLFLRIRDASTARDLRGGWYDAGDYNQYTSWTAEYITSLLNSYLENPKVWTDDFGIPESGNGVPDILDEVKWGLDWLERMQNPDGSMLSILGRDSASPPSSAKKPSYYGPAN